MTGIYSNVIQAKDNTLIPVFTSGQTMYSKYNPIRDAENFLCNCKNDELQFFLVCGIGNALHIKALRNKFPKAKIVAFETYQEDLDFLEKHFKIKKISEDFNFEICLQENIPEKIISTYIPILHGNFSMLQQRAWINNNKENTEKITFIVKNVLEDIASDISTQSFFGKIWHRNIIQNLLISPNIVINNDIFKTTKKEAFIVAAGPSLDYAIKKLKSENYRNKQFIISTDTALPVLFKNKIQPDMVVTIDGQNISRLHFLGKLSKKICIAADLTCSPSIIREAIQQKCSVIFTRSNHPLCTLISDYFSQNFGYEISQICSGAGTVTITAVDIALKMGFNKINITGSDFAYKNGQSYAKGTYFDDIISPKTSRINTYEQEYMTTFFSKKLIENEKGLKTSINLNMYSQSFYKYIKEKKLYLIDESIDYGISTFVTNIENTNTIKYFIPNNNECHIFLDWYISMLNEEKSEIISSILPLAAWNTKKNAETDIFSSLKLAYYQTVRYNNMHGK